MVNISNSPQLNGKDYNSVLYFNIPVSFTVTIPGGIGDTAISIDSPSSLSLPAGTYPMGKVSFTTQTEQPISKGANIIMVDALDSELEIGDTTFSEDPITGNPKEVLVEMKVYASLESAAGALDFNQIGVTGSAVYLTGRCISPRQLPQSHLNYETIKAYLRRSKEAWIEGSMRLELYHASRFKLYNYFGDWIAGFFEVVN